VNTETSPGYAGGGVERKKKTRDECRTNRTRCIVSRCNESTG
jgi:hypothetical protein